MRLFVAFAIFISFLSIPFQSDEAFGDQYGRTGALIILIKPDKAKYEIGEPVYFTLTIKNHTTVPLYINKRLDALLDISWNIFSEIHGTIKMKTTPPRAATKDDFIRLEVNEIFGKQLPDMATLIDMPIMRRGRYAVRLGLEQKEKIMGEETWTGKAVTNLIWIEVKTPKKI